MTGRPIRVAVDAMGADRGPDEIVAGAIAAASDEIELLIVGPRGLETHGLELVEASDVIAMEDKPTEAVRSKPNSSLVVACRLVGEGRADAVVSPGNTGAMLAASLFNIRRLRGVLRPAIAVVIPARDEPSVLIDAGANADARPEHLVQFAEMGLVLSEEVLGVGGRVVVADGFTGNVTLKVVEGTIKTILDALRDEISATARGKLGGLLIRPAARRLRTRLDPDTYGGAYLLGLRGLVVIAHGGSSGRAIANAVRLAARGVEHDVVGRLAERLGGEKTVLESATSTTPTPQTR